MEVAEQIVVMNQARVAQVAAPRELYEHPGSEFVMRFVGPVAEMGDQLVRPHDIEILPLPDSGAEEAMVRRVHHLGFEVRVELEAAGGRRVAVQVTRDRAMELELEPGQIVWLRPDRQAVLAAPKRSAA